MEPAQLAASAAKSLQVYISRLRRALEGDRGDGAEGVIVTRGRGYLVRVAPGELDLARFERLLEEGSDTLADGAPDRALELLREALALWRGPPLAEFAYEPFARSEIARLEELHLSALELRIDAELALGRHAQVIGELESLIDRNPFRERLRAQLMLALYRSDRQAEALQAFQDARGTLVEELGIESSRQALAPFGAPAVAGCGRLSSMFDRAKAGLAVSATPARESGHDEQHTRKGSP